jgi:hypothetical protein
MSSHDTGARVAAGDAADQRMSPSMKQLADG